WIGAVPEELEWSGSFVIAGKIHDEFVNRASEALGNHLRASQAESPRIAKGLETAIDRASDEAFERVLLAPETTLRLFYRRDEVVTTSTFLLDALTAEAVLEGSATRPPDREIWTALGDAQVAPSGAVLCAPSTIGRIPLDLASPYA